MFYNQKTSVYFTLVKRFYKYVKFDKCKYQIKCILCFYCVLCIHVVLNNYLVVAE